jgi:hypothetical protein
MNHTLNKRIKINDNFFIFPQKMLEAAFIKSLWKPRLTHSSGWMRELFLAEPFTVVVEALPRDF